MRKVIEFIGLAVCLAIIIIGLSLLAGFVAHQVIDWKQNQTVRNRELLAEKEELKKRIEEIEKQLK